MPKPMLEVHADGHGDHGRHPRPRCPACKPLIEAKKSGCCPVERRKLVRHETLDLATGESKPVSEEWRTEACNVPLFGDRERGICSGCARGWTHEHNYPTDNGKAAIETALAATNDTATKGIKP